MDQYDTIIIGYPIWHGQAPRIISTFLESYDFSGRQFFRSVLPAAAGLVPARITCTFYVLILRYGWRERDLKPVHRRKQ